MVCLSHRRFVEFCHQEGFNPRARLFNTVTGIRDIYKVQGHLDFDVVFLTDCEEMSMFDEVRAAIMCRTGLHNSNGRVYYLHT